MTWVDLAIIGVLLLSGVLAFTKGFVREILGIVAWAGALYAAVKLFNRVEPFALRFASDPTIAAVIAFGSVFLLTLVVLSLIAATVGRHMRRSALGGLDRALGLAYGLARGAVLVVAAYIVGQWLSPTEHWPAPVLEARSLPLVYSGAEWLANTLRPACRMANAECELKVEPPPPRKLASAEDLLSPRPAGYALELLRQRARAGEGQEKSR